MRATTRRARSPISASPRCCWTGRSTTTRCKVLDAAHPEPFAALFADARGDVYVAQGKAAEARLAYQAALDKLPKSSAYRNVVELKRDALGSAK